MTNQTMEDVNHTHPHNEDSVQNTFNRGRANDEDEEK